VPHAKNGVVAPHHTMCLVHDEDVQDTINALLSKNILIDKYINVEV